MQSDTLQRYFAELLGTFVLVFGGSVAIVSAGRMGGLGGAPQVAIALAFGLALLAGLYAFAERSGGHFNPAVSLGLALDRRIEWVHMLMYWVFQLVGAILAGLGIWALSSKLALKGTLTTPGIGVSSGKALLAEILFTAIFLAVILASTKSDRHYGNALVAIPLTLVAIHLAIIPISGSSVNPARTLGPDIVAGKFTSVWIYIVGPLVGAVIGWVVYAGVMGTLGKKSESA